MDRNHVTMLDSEVVANNPVDAGAAIIELVIGKHNQHSILSLLASHEDCIPTEKLERVHGGLGKGDNAIVIVDGIGDPFRMISIAALIDIRVADQKAYINWLGFFFFLRMAVAVSSS